MTRPVQISEEADAEMAEAARWYEIHRDGRFPYHVVYIEPSDRLQILAIAHDHRRPGYRVGRMGNWFSAPSNRSRVASLGAIVCPVELWERSLRGRADLAASSLAARSPQDPTNTVTVAAPASTLGRNGLRAGCGAGGTAAWTIVT